MRKLIKSLILATLIASSASSANQEVDVGYLHIDQDLFGTIEFNMPAAQIGYTYWTDSGFGARVQLARSTETINSLYIEGKEYSNKITMMASGTLLYRVNLTDNLNLHAGVGKTDYHSVWKVNGVEPAWSKGVDSDWSYYAGFSYKINSTYIIKGEYADLYRKDKIGYGREETKYFGLGLVYRF